MKFHARNFEIMVGFWSSYHTKNTFCMLLVDVSATYWAILEKTKRDASGQELPNRWPKRRKEEKQDRPKTGHDFKK